MMAGIDEQLLMAHVDGELDDLNARRVAKALAEDRELRAVAEEQRRLKDQLAGHYGPVVDEAIPPRLLAMLGTNVVPMPLARPGIRPGFGWRSWAAMAATFVVGIIAAQTMRQPGGPAGVTGDSVVAAGPLVEALDSQLATEQSRSAPTRILVSFAAKDGRICRTFENQVMTGLACREGDGWNVIAQEAARPGPGGEYRQAASGTGVVMRISQELMKGEPFDARVERQARDTGWESRR